MMYLRYLCVLHILKFCTERFVHSEQNKFIYVYKCMYMYMYL